MTDDEHPGWYRHQGISIRQRFARWLMRRCTNLVARIDYKAVPKVSPWAFTFESGRGAVINETGCSSERRGAMLLYLDDYDYERAFSDSETITP